MPLRPPLCIGKCYSGPERGCMQAGGPRFFSRATRLRRALLGFLLAAPALLAASTPVLAADCSATSASPVALDSVPDARTIVLADGRRIALAGVGSFALLVDRPADADRAELKELRALVAAGSLRLVLLTQRLDRRGRFPALIFQGDRLVQADLAGAGVALMLPGRTENPCLATILAAEEQARTHRRGYWTDPATVPLAARPDVLSHRIGGFAMMEGKVLSANERRTRTYLNFGRKWSEDVTVEIAAVDRSRFTGDLAPSSLVGHRVRVRGFLAEHGGPMMELTSPAQLQRLPESVSPATDRP
ncbi:Endonuclease YncB, thermonuclease family [Faunimonas pinastri]|uniref:Endonuclease YncB, thermonuclease family n=1 Tax=Faunimonas pinastri TaxID=1855383 RepID=A0A1H9MIY0_9HYPH|nr:Endonuclease YncB, thermonuclease family [Faunimonas pinastri]